MTDRSAALWLDYLRDQRAAAVRGYLASEHRGLRVYWRDAALHYGRLLRRHKGPRHAD